MVMTYSQAKVQGQQSVDPEDKVEKTVGRTDGRTRGGCISTLTNAAGDYLARKLMQYLQQTG